MIPYNIIWVVVFLHTPLYLKVSTYTYSANIISKHTLHTCTQIKQVCYLAEFYLCINIMLRNFAQATCRWNILGDYTIIWLMRKWEDVCAVRTCVTCQEHVGTLCQRSIQTTIGHCLALIDSSELLMLYQGKMEMICLWFLLAKYSPRFHSPSHTHSGLLVVSS